MGTDIDHFRPKSSYPQVAFEWSNYFLACSHCNSNAKRGEFPTLADGSAALIDPTELGALDHLTLSPSTGYYIGRDVRGEESIRVFALNRQVCVDGRRNAWVALGAICVQYASTPTKRRDILRVIHQYPFQGVRFHLRRVMLSSERKKFLSDDLVRALDVYPELIAF